MKELKLEVSDLERYIREESLLYARCSKYNKEMRITLYGGIKIFKDGKLVYETVYPDVAVKTFNKL